MISESCRIDTGSRDVREYGRFAIREAGSMRRTTCSMFDVTRKPDRGIGMLHAIYQIVER
jgi:hypothetical protein